MSRSSRWAGFAFLLIVLAYLALSVFVHPGADDLTYARDTRRDGYIVALRDQYLLWNGRYSSNVLELAGPMVWGSFAFYKAVAASMIVMTVITLYMFVRALVGEAWTRGQVTTAALAMSALFLGGVPALGESIYWYTGSVTYHFSAILLLVLGVLTVVALRAGAQRSVWSVIGCGLLTAVIVGMNEVAMLIVVAFHVANLMLGAIEHRRRTMTISAFMLSIAIVCGLVVWLAPGNAVRSAMFPLRHQPLRSIAMTALQTVRFAADWSTAGSMLLATLVYLPLGGELVRATPRIRALGRRSTALCLFAGTFAIIPLTIFPPYWASGELGQHRTISVAYFLFLPLWFTSLTAALAAGWVSVPEHWLTERRVWHAALILLVLALGFTHNAYGVAADFAYGRPVAFDREMSTRFSHLRACTVTPERPCVIPPLSVKLESFLLPDISSDSSHWVNDAYATYFGLRQVVAGSPR